MMHSRIDKIIFHILQQKQKVKQKDITATILVIITTINPPPPSLVMFHNTFLKKYYDNMLL
ncbi:hypothetical protein PP707_06955, partial [Acetobacter pasteurianus]|nr:hypothetical protein [Acetobacter pasteurianus]